MIRPGRISALVCLMLLVACVGRDGVLPEPAVTSITPKSGIVMDGTRVTISGLNFYRSTVSGSAMPGSLTAEVCGVPLEQVELTVESERTVMLPPASSVRVQIGDELSGVIGAGATVGPSDVKVSLPGGQQLVLPAAFECMAPEVSASLVTDVTTGPAPLKVVFDGSGSSSTTGVISDYAWYFPDGSTGSGATISHTFTMVGVHEVTLVVTDDTGASDSASVQIEVVNSAPVAVYSTTPDPAAGSGPLLVTFDASGSSDPDGTIVSFDWDFGDGTGGTGEIVSHTFTSGTYTVTLTVEDDQGLTSTATGQVLVDNSPPVAQFTTSPDPVAGSAPLKVLFDASGSVDPDGSIVSYDWEFGSSGTAAGMSVEHTFLNSGDYPVRLTVTDDAGATATAELLVQVSNAPPVAVPEIVSTVGYEVTFSASGSYDPDGGPLTYSWDVGDGSPPVAVETFTHTYVQSGDYTVTLTVVDSDSDHDAAVVTASPVNITPTAVALVEPFPASGYAPLTVRFSAVPGSYDQPGGMIVDYEWIVDGNVMSNNAVLEHTFSTVGTQPVLLTVTDNEGSIGVVTTNVDVLASEVHSVQIQEGDQDLLRGDVVSLTATVDGVGTISQDVTWQSSDAGVASVDSNGIVTAMTAGTVTITATSEQDTSVSDNVQVSVRAPLGTSDGEQITDMAVDEHDNIYLTGHVNASDGLGGLDILLLKLDPQGKLLWRETYGTQSRDLSWSIALDPGDNSIILTGETHGELDSGAAGDSEDTFVLKISADDRSVLWTYQYGDSGHDRGNEVVVDGNGDIYFTGVRNRNVTSPGSCPHDCEAIIVGRLSSGGTPVQVVLHGDHTGGSGEVITLGKDGQILVAGHSKGVFGEPFQGQQGAYLMQLNPDDLNVRSRLAFVDTAASDFVDDLQVTDDGRIIWVGQDNTVNHTLAWTVVRVLNAADLSVRMDRWFTYRHAVRGSLIDSEGYLVIGAVDADGIVLNRLDPDDLSTVMSENVVKPPAPEVPNPQMWASAIGLQSDGTLVLAGFGNTDYFEPNQGGFDPFVWITRPW